jgi:type II secretory pathway component GspD/PulD (secretin)
MKIIRLTESDLKKVVTKILNETDDLPMNEPDNNIQVFSDTLDVLDQQKMVNKDQFCSQNVKVSSLANNLTNKLVSSKIPEDQTKQIVSNMMTFVKNSNKDMVKNSIKMIKGLITQPKTATQKIFQMIGIKTDQNAGKTPQPTNNGQISEQTPGIVLIMFSSYPMMVLSAIVAMFLLMNLAWLVEGLFMDKKNYCGNRF